MRFILAFILISALFLILSHNGTDYSDAIGAVWKTLSTIIRHPLDVLDALVE